MNFRFAKLLALLFAGALSITACSTIGSVTDAINPFNDGDDNKDQGEIPDDPERISILSLDEELKVAGTMLTSEIILPEVYTNTDWAQTGGYANHAPQRTDAPGDLDRLWSRDVGKGSHRKGRVVASPVVAAGRIFAIDGDNRVSATDAATGGKIWAYTVRVAKRKKTRRGGRSFVERVRNPLSFGDSGGQDKEAVGGGVAVADDRVYVTSGYGLVLALDAATGAELWRTKTNTPIHSAPAVDNGRVFAVSDDNELFALNGDSGEVQWTYQAIIEPVRILTAPSPAIVGDVVVAPFSSGEIVAFRVQNGGVLWQDALNASGQLTPLAALNDIGSGPVIVDGYVFAGAQNGSLGAFDLRTGQRIWSQPAGSNNFPLVAGDFIYAITTEGQVACLYKNDGTVIWMTQLQAFRNVRKRKDRIAWTGPVMAGERLLLMSSRGEAVELNPYDGAILRTFKLAGDVFVPPIVANNSVYYITDDAKLVALR